jgi:hypothetical protein
MLYKVGYQISPAGTDKQQDRHDCKATDCDNLDKTFYANLHPVCDNHHFDGKCDCDLYNH